MHYLTYRIHTLEPVKMGSQNKSENTEYALDYIAGSSVRGALLGGFCRKNGINLSKDPETKRHLLKDVYFLNAYPAAGNRRAIPAPLAFLGQKQTLSQYNGDPIAVKTVFRAEETMEAGDRAVKKESFALLTSDAVKGIKVRKSFKLHVSVNGREKMNGDRAMFRYEAISEGQDFIGYIASEDEAVLNRYRELLEKNPIYYIGGSKGSGYGKSRISVMEDSVPVVERGTFESRNEGNEFFVYMLSDAVIYDREGFPMNYIPTEILEQNLDLEEVRYTGGASGVVRITGYNSTWKAAKPQYVGIKSGSVFRYRYKGSLEGKKSLIHALEDRGIGIMRQEGFGRFMILPQLSQNQWMRYRGKEADVGLPELSGENRAQAVMMMDHLYRRQVRRGIDRRVVNIANNTVISKQKKTQVAKLLGIIESNRTAGPEEFRQAMEMYFEEMAAKKNNPAAARFFEGVTVCVDDKMITLREYMEMCAASSGDVEHFVRQEEFRLSSAAERIGFRPSKKTVYQYTLEYMDKYLRYIRRGEGEENA